MSSRPDYKIFACSQSQELAQKIAQELNTDLGKSSIQRFSDGEFQPAFEESVRGRRVFIIGSTMPPADNLMEMLLMIDAAKRASARHITAVMPYYGWARQDRKDKPRVSIGAKMVANILQSAGATRIMTMDLHADQIQGFFEKPVDHLYASTIFLPYIQSLNLDNVVIASPDMGGSKRAYAYSKYLKCDVVISYKQRSRSNVVDKMEVIGEVKNKHVIIVDDMIDTAGTIVKASEMMLEKGALSVRALATHPVFSGKAYERLEQSPLEEIVVTDTLPLKRTDVNKIKVVSCAPLFAKVMNKVHVNETISGIFLM